MNSRQRTAQTFDFAIAVGTALALYWSLYVQPRNGEVLALALGALPILVGLERSVDPDQYLTQGLAGLLAVALGGMAPASVLVNTRAGDWLVGSSPLPLALGIAVAVVLCVLVVRRTLARVVTPAVDATG